MIKFLCERYALGYRQQRPTFQPNSRNFNLKIGNFELVFELEKIELRKHLILEYIKILKKYFRHANNFFKNPMLKSLNKYSDESLKIKTKPNYNKIILMVSTNLTNKII